MNDPLEIYEAPDLEDIPLERKEMLLTSCKLEIVGVGFTSADGGCSKNPVVFDPCKNS